MGGGGAGTGAVVGGGTRQGAPPLGPQISQIMPNMSFSAVRVIVFGYL